MYHPDSYSYPDPLGGMPGKFIEPPTPQFQFTQDTLLVEGGITVNDYKLGSDTQRVVDERVIRIGSKNLASIVAAWLQMRSVSGIDSPGTYPHVRIMISVDNEARAEHSETKPPPYYPPGARTLDPQQIESDEAYKRDAAFRSERIKDMCEPQDKIESNEERERRLTRQSNEERAAKAMARDALKRIYPSER